MSSNNKIILKNNTVQKLNVADALGIWIYLQTLPKDYRIVRKEVRTHFGIGRDKMNRILSYLHKYNFIEYKNERNEDGTYKETKIKVLDGEKAII